MKPSEAALRGLIEQWLRKAAADLAAAEYLAAQTPGPSRPFGEIICFHCQQAVEKYLKAFLVRHQIEFPKTHDISKLLDCLKIVNSAMANSLRGADFLTPFGVEMRYPGDAPEVLPGGDAHAIEMARRVRDAVIASIQPYLGLTDVTL